MRASILALLSVGSCVTAVLGADTNSTAERWNARYGSADSFVYGAEPVRFLVEQMPTLVLRKGRALCLAAGEGRYDLITDFYYHQPDLFPKAMAALKPGGFFILQNFSIDQPATGRFGPKDPAYLARPNEVLEVFSGFRIRHYEDTVVELEEGMHQGPGAVVRIVVENSPVIDSLAK